MAHNDDDDLPDFAPAKIEDEARDEIEVKESKQEEVTEEDLKFDPIKKEELGTADQILAAQEKLMGWYEKLIAYKNKILGGGAVAKKDEEKSIEVLIKEEKEKCITENAKFSLIGQATAMEKTSWGLTVLGSWRKTMQIRKGYSIDRTTEAVEDEAKL